MSNTVTHDSLPLQPTTTGSLDVITPASQSNATSKRVQTHNNLRSTTHLDVPSFQHRPTRRSSSDSILSDFSELSYLSHDFQDTLSRKISNASHYSVASSSGAGAGAGSGGGSGDLPRTWRQRLHGVYLQNYGAILVVISQLFGSGMNVATRLLEQPGPHGPPMHPFQILFTRQSLTALLCTLYAVTTKSIPHFPLGPPDRKVRMLLVLRGLFGFFGVFGIYFSLLYLPLSEATVLTFLAPILTCYLCSVLLPGETFSRQQQIAGMVSLCGVVFIARPASLFAATRTGTGAETGIAGSGFPPDSMMGNGTGSTIISRRSDDEPTVPTPEQHLLAIGIAMIGVVGATGAITSIRAIGTRAHAFVSINYFSVWSSIVSLFALLVIPSVSFRLPANLQEWMLLLSLGICGFCMQGLLTMGLAYGGPAATHSAKDDVFHNEGVNTQGDIEMQNRPGPSTNQLPGKEKKSKAKVSSGSGTRATSMIYTQMLFALSADRIFFGSVPDVWSWIGSGLILAGAIWVAAARDTVKADPKKSETGDGGEVDEAGESSIGLLTRIKSGSGNRDVRVEDVNGEVREEQVGLLNGGPELDDDLDDRLRR